MLRSAVAHIVASAVEALKAGGELPAELSVPVEIDDPRNPEHGDFACNYALAAAKPAGMNPRALAERLVEAILNADQGSVEPSEAGARKMISEGSPPHPRCPAPLIHEVEVAGPGFLNIRLKPESVGWYVGHILEKGSDLPKTQNPEPKSLNVEFVSVNPNGPITVGSARGAAFGDTLCRVFEAVGHRVHREYYVNDGTNSEQMRLFAAAVNHRAWMLMAGRPPHRPESDIVDAWVKSHFFALGDFIGRHGLTFDASWFEDRVRSYLQSEAALDKGELAIGEDFRAELLDFVGWLHMSYRSWLVDPEFLDKLYKGDYVNDLAAELIEENVGALREHLDWWKSHAERKMLARQMQDLAAFKVPFDTWFCEQSLHESGAVDRSIEELNAKGAADEEPCRLVLKMARGGVVEAVERQEQAEGIDEDDLGAPASAGTESSTLHPPSSVANQTEEGSFGSADLRSAPEPPSPTPSPSGAQASPQGEGASTLWLRSTKFGDDMDRVLRRRDGRLTYIASDVAYHRDKLTDESGVRGTGPVDRMITILGPDHHGYIMRLQAVVAALLEAPVADDDSSRVDLTDIEKQIYRSPEERTACRAALAEAQEKLEVVIFQIVRFVKDGKPAPMRKRDGNIYELRDLINELGAAVAPNADPEEQKRIGKDVARFFYLMRSHDTHMDFDIDLATKQSDENPVFYVQYAHARICSVLRKAQDSRIGGLGGWDLGQPFPTLQSLNPSILTHARETALIKKILDLPDEVLRCAEDYGVHRLTTYAVELARTYHHFYDACRVIQPDQPELSQARLALCEAARIGLQSTLDLLGVSAPERMDREPI